jgi:hypothetical protein
MTPEPFAPKIQRLLGAKRMTMAIALAGTNGIVLAADTEETIPGYMKRSQTKILAGHHGVGKDDRSVVDENRPMVAVSGAGHADYLDSINEEMVDAFLASKKILLSEIKPQLQANLIAFYKNHVIPFAQFPSGDERPEVQIRRLYGPPVVIVLNHVWDTEL